MEPGPTRLIGDNNGDFQWLILSDPLLGEGREVDRCTTPNPMWVSAIGDTSPALAGILVVWGYTKRGGHLGPVLQLEQLLSNIGLRDHSVVSGRLWNTDLC